MKNYQAYSDEQLIERIRNGEKQPIDYIMEKYKNEVKKKAKAMYLIGGDNDDLIQEGMIGLFKAIRDYNKEKEASFYSFAILCISRQMYTAVQASKRQKHTPLNSYISLYSENMTETEDGLPLLNMMQSISEKNPEELLIDKENVEQIERKIEENLSTFEKEVLDLYIAGLNYHQIAEVLDKSPKSTDNALQRIRLKLGSILRK